MDVILDIIMVLLSLFFSSIPIFFYVWFVWWIDHHDREPLVLIAVAFLWGAVASILISLVLETVFAIPMLLFSEGAQKAVSFVFLAPIIEEISKSLILLVFLFNRRFNRMLDGIVYGAVVGFGFAASENLMYYVSTYFTKGVGIWIIVVIMRTMLTAVGHAVYTAITGAGVSIMKFARQRWMRFVFPPMALLVAIVLHSLFNLGVISTELYSLLFFPISIAIVFFGVIAIAIALFLGLHDEGSCIRTQLADELRSGLITEGEYEIVQSYLKRRSRSFKILSEYGYTEYRAATRLFEYEMDLAFAKDELSRTSSEKQRKDVLRRINELRDSIRSTRKKLGDAAGLLT
jgi:RsiW-degrading membrane proteinase PrsW (M82 family)